MQHKAQEANDEAANTIKGAWKEVQTAFQNLFSSQSELLRQLFDPAGVADAINAINTPAGMLAVKIALRHGCSDRAEQGGGGLKSNCAGWLVPALDPNFGGGQGCICSQGCGRCRTEQSTGIGQDDHVNDAVGGGGIQLSVLLQ